MLRVARQHFWQELLAGGPSGCPHTPSGTLPTPVGVSQGLLACWYAGRFDDESAAVPSWS